MLTHPSSLPSQQPLCCDQRQHSCRVKHGVYLRVPASSCSCHPSSLMQVAKFLDAGMNRLQTVDPNEGSNI